MSVTRSRPRGAAASVGNSRLALHRRKPGLKLARGTASRRSAVARRAAPVSSAARSDVAVANGAVANGAALDIERAVETCVVPAGAGDHHAIHQFLTVVFHAPSWDAFLASLDDPFYEPVDRLLVKRGEAIVAHAHLAKRTMQFAGQSLPVAGFSWLGTLPEYRGQGYATRLLRAAHRRMAADGAVLGILRTRAPHFFRREGWAVCGRHSQSRAAAREVLAQIANRAGAAPQTAGGLCIRPWRQVELPALLRLYDRGIARRDGGIERSEAYWRWLLSGKSIGQIFVASVGPERQELDHYCASIVGYCITADDSVLEIATDPAHPTAATQLLARACGEAIERDVNDITLHAPPDHPLHGLFEAAHGTLHHQEAHLGEVFMVKLLDPHGFLRAQCGDLRQRAEAAGLPRPCELGLSIEGEKHRLAIGRRSVKLLPGGLGRSYLRCNIAEFTRLVMGHLDIEEAAASGRLEVSTRLALQAAQALFPRRPLWRSPLDDRAV